MKHIRNRNKVPKWRFFMLIIAAALPLSCASRAASVMDDGIEPDDPFERAYWNVKHNTPLIEKYFEVDETGTITVKGKCVFDQKEFLVLYDLDKAEKTADGYFRITFSVEDPAALASQSDSNRSDANRGRLFRRKASQKEVSRGGELLWKPVPDKTGLLFSFDDEFMQSWRQYFDLLDAFGARVTYFINGEAGTSAEEGLPAFCFEALQRGHCIGYHTLHHYNLKKVGYDVFYSETIEAAQGFLDFGIPLNAFAYPYGFYDDWMHESLAPYFKFTRGFGARFRLYDAEAPARFAISKSIDNIQYPDDEQFERQMRLMLLSAKFIGSRIIPFTTHNISNKADWGIRPNRLAYVLQMAKELKIRFYTYRDFS